MCGWPLGLGLSRFRGLGLSLRCNRHLALAVRVNRAAPLGLNSQRRHGRLFLQAHLALAVRVNRAAGLATRCLGQALLALAVRVNRAAQLRLGAVRNSELLELLSGGENDIHHCVVCVCCVSKLFHYLNISYSIHYSKGAVAVIFNCVVSLIHVSNLPGNISRSTMWTKITCGRINFDLWLDR